MLQINHLNAFLSVSTLSSSLACTESYSNRAKKEHHSVSGEKLNKNQLPSFTGSFFYLTHIYTFA